MERYCRIYGSSGFDCKKERGSILKKYIKKFVLLGMAGLMMSGSFFMAPNLAEEVQAEEDDVFQVLFPVNTDHVFDFIMDPQGLIGKTDGEAYGNLTFEERATLFFRRYDGRVEEDYSSASDALVITNTGTADVDIVLSVSISPDSVEKIILTDDNTFTDDSEASLYLALTDGDCTVPVTGEADAVIHTTLPGSEKMEGVPGEYRFWLEGAVNSNGDWSEVTGEAPRVTVTWSVSAVPDEQEDIEQPEVEENTDGLETSETDANQEDSETSETVEVPDDSGIPEVEHELDGLEEPAGSDEQENNEPMEEDKDQGEHESSGGTV